MPVTVTLVSAESTEGVVRTYYRVDDEVAPGTERANEGPFAMDGDGTLILRFWSVLEHAGGTATSTVSARYVFFDHACPAVTSDVRPEYGARASVRLRGTDAASGIRRLDARLDGEPTRTVGPAGVLSLTTSRLGRHAVTYRATDAAGNVTTGRLAFVVKRAQVIVRSPASNAVALTRRRGVALWTPSAIVKEAGRAPLRNKVVYLQRSADGKAWLNATRAMRTDSLGAVLRTNRLTAKGKTYWRWYSPGTSAFAAAYSAVTSVIVR